MAKYKSDPQENEIEVGKEIIDGIIRQGTFEPFNRPSNENRDFFTFREIGDHIEGILCSPITNLRRSTSYPIKQDNGTVIEIFGNKLLHRIIRKNELVGKKVRIVFIGEQQVPNCRWLRKIYRVYEIGFKETQKQVGG